MQLKLIAAIAVLMLMVASLCAAGCTVILPETQNAPSNATTKVASSSNVTVSLQALGERQRYSINPLVSYSASEGYKLAVYNVSITNLDGEQQAGNTTFFTLTASNGTTYPPVLNSLPHRVIGQAETLQGQVVFEIPKSATPKSLTYDDYANRITVNL